jgi:hypothetical protein
LFENAKLIANAITDGWHVKRRQRIDKACRQTPQPTVAQSRFDIDRKQIVKFQVEFDAGLFRQF